MEKSTVNYRFTKYWEYGGQGYYFPMKVLVPTFKLIDLTLLFQNVTIDGAGKSVSGISLTLKDVNLFTTGLYGCEASSEGSFHTDLVRKFMTVVGELLFELLLWYQQTWTMDYVSVKPSDAPVLVGLKPRYRVGETLEMSCYINNTYPAANISWYINGVTVTTTIIILSEFWQILTVFSYENFFSTFCKNIHTENFWITKFVPVLPDFG